MDLKKCVVSPLMVSGQYNIYIMNYMTCAIVSYNHDMYLCWIYFEVGD